MNLIILNNNLTMFRSLNISKVQKSSLTNSTDFDFLMKSMHREKDKEK